MASSKAITLLKGERVPKYTQKIHSHMDGRYNWYYLFNSDGRVFAHLAEPRHKGMPRKLITVERSN